ncbi:hypothetical protein QF045_002576 [Pseudomonas sp. W4I3]|nr:hypothetical protein [Pseudomonas sp. W4I3]
MSRKSAFFFDELSLWHSAGLHALTLSVGGWVQPIAKPMYRFAGWRPLKHW